MGITVTLEGFEKLDRTLLELSGDTGHRIMRKAARAAGQVVQQAITDAAPVRTELRKTYGENGNPAWSLPPGALKSDITLRVVENKEDGGVTAIVRPGKYTLPVAEFIEAGHAIVRGGRSNRAGNHIGNVPAHPFVRPAFEASRDAAVAAAEETIADEIIKELKRMGAV